MIQSFLCESRRMVKKYLQFLIHFSIKNYWNEAAFFSSDCFGSLTRGLKLIWNRNRENFLEIRFFIRLNISSCLPNELNINEMPKNELSGGSDENHEIPSIVCWREKITLHNDLFAELCWKYSWKISWKNVRIKKMQKKTNVCSWSYLSGRQSLMNVPN